MFEFFFPSNNENLEEEYIAFYSESSIRVGARIRNIRTTKGMSQGELGALVGLSADRIQKYENGARRPKLEILKEIAKALDVSPFALMDPVPWNTIGVMYTLFELMENIGIEFEYNQEDSSYRLDIKGITSLNNLGSPFYPLVKEWYAVYSRMKNKIELAKSDEELKQIKNEYYNWIWNYPNSCFKGKDSQESDETEEKKAVLLKKLSELQEEYNKLVNN